MDGTLIDSMTYHVRAWKEAFAEYGYHPDELEFYLNEGVKHPITVRDRLFKLGIVQPDEQTIEKIFMLKRQIFNEIVKVGPIKDVMALLNEIKGKIKLGVVTAGIKVVRDRVISELFEGYFDVVVGYESTQKGKPDPDPYLKGAELIGLPKENILAIENAPMGIKSAVSAGLTCWAVCTTLKPGYLQEAHQVFPGFAELHSKLTSEKLI